MLQPAELSLEEMGDLAAIIPAADPEVKLVYRSIPEFGEEPRRTIIPVCEPTLGGNEMKYVQQAIETNWISSAGRFIREFEARFAEACGVQYAIACANGTVAMHLAMATLGLEPGDEVIIPTFTMIATANAVTYCGAKPVLVDMEPEYWQMDLNQVEDKITPRTKAIVPVHIYGHPTDMDPLMALAEKHGLTVIEDAAEAHGAEYKGRRTGGLGHAAGFSFYGNKIITTGEGGMVTTNDRELARLAWNLRDHAFSRERHFWHKYIGFNYRMTNLQAAVGLAQVEQLDAFVAARRRNAAEYTRRLQGIPGIRTPSEAPWAKNVYWMYGILVDEAEYGMSRDQLRRVLAEHGIETRTFFIPMHCQPVYWKQFRGERYPVAEDLCKRGFYLPSASSLRIEEIEYITRVIREACPNL
ncbi:MULTISPECIES: DegT/DnrJ/EryC1/StrS family aminotransferase [Caldilinea]|jgi:perosamine synthetase|uniref:Putative aminotransferase n=1 Tax=Caldilinea aerophila (strain DSM 14535 / JCM 11387 / NBRC 104270 / STL-6-O1) TaxID=926550 RepID=I0I1J3_CALAS|nr:MULTISPECIES: DegT/DnrJ/EryC1/StrS family aminotransferase [Caldilinea]MBO9392726.1 DegT/DnrJ/EryC1/StrS family aminotransferase [Caldilinea sp.]BAL99130.1 putative aminotransferase [Caldilinea aerophila DSM 14535 = NBRC 104270]GIV74278.1 MAG: aminotransferase DegT [Caldilinea sp.]